MTPYILDCHCPHINDCPKADKCPRLGTEIRASSNNPIDLMIIGEFPNKFDCDQGKPFSGDMGKLLWTFIRESWPDDAQYAVTNILRYPYSAGNPNPIQKEQAMLCRDALYYDIDLLNPRKILLLGKLALEMLTGQEFIGSTRGRPLYVTTPSGKQILATSTYHPSMCMDNGNHLSILAEDARRLLTNFQDVYVIPDKSQHHYQILDNTKTIHEFFDWIYRGQTKQTVIACDFEARNLNKFKDNALLTTQWSVDGKTGYVIPMSHPESPFYGNEEALNFIRQWHTCIFGSEPNQVSFGYFCGHNLQYENIQSLREFKTYWRSAPCLDTMSGIFLLNENLTDFFGDGHESSMGLKWAVEYWGNFYGYHTQNMKIALEYRNTGTLDLLDLQKVAEYGALDVTSNWHLLWALAQSAQTQPDNYEPRWWTSLIYHMSPGIKFFSNVTYNGFYLDKEYNEWLRKDTGLIKKEFEQINQTLRNSPYVQKLNKRLLAEHSGGMTGLFDDEDNGDSDWLVDINKTDQQQELFFDIMGLEPISRTKTGKPQVNKDFQEAYGNPDSPNLKELHPEVEAFVSLQAAKKMKGTYVDKLFDELNQPDGSDGRIRPEFGITKTVTGRTNSYKPNMQQVPRGSTPLRTAIRRQFSSPKGKVLINLDYCANEVRWLAQESNDIVLAENFVKAQQALEQFKKDTGNKALEKLYESLADIHKNTASLMYGVDVDQVTKQMRQDSKTCTFGIPYGRSNASMAHQVGCTEDEMADKVAKFFAPFPRLKEYIEQQPYLAREYGYVEDSLHKRRRLLACRTGVRKIMESGGRQSVNSPTQHSASTCAFMCNANYFEEYVWPKHRYDWIINNSVHDSETTEIPITDIKEFVLTSHPYYTTGISNYIEQHFGTKLIVPIEVEYELGFSLAEKVKVHPAFINLDEIQEFFIWWDKNHDRRASADDILLLWDGPMGDKARKKKAEKEARK